MYTILLAINRIMCKRCRDIGDVADDDDILLHVETICKFDLISEVLVKSTTLILSIRRYKIKKRNHLISSSFVADVSSGFII